MMMFKSKQSARILVSSLAIGICCCVIIASATMSNGVDAQGMGPFGAHPMMGGHMGAAAASSASSSAVQQKEQVQETTTKHKSTSTASSAAAAAGSSSAAGGLVGGLGGVIGGAAASGSAAVSSGEQAATTEETTTTQKTSTAASSGAASSSSAAGAAVGGSMAGSYGPAGFGGYGPAAGYMGGPEMGAYMAGAGGSSIGSAAAGAASTASSGAAAATTSSTTSSSTSASSASAAAGAVGAAGVAGSAIGLQGAIPPYGMGYDPTLGAAAASGAIAAPYGDMGAGEALAGAAAGAAAVDGGPIVAPSTLLARQALATDALSNAQAESAIAGADMVAHGANNARSASLASNAYRQAKLASARDRVNIAGTIQNTARISDGAIATHDAATKAEDSLLGSELAVDSAATVLDSDGAYIPPVTSSLLRSLPYGRLGIRNIMPKPLTHSSNLLPDVWLNGQPVNYQNVPLRMLPYGLGGSMAYSGAVSPAGLGLAGVGAAGLAPGIVGANGAYIGAGLATAAGQMVSGQTLIPNNGIPLSSRYFDPSAAYIVGSMRGIADSSVLPVLANGQLEAHDEVAMANMIRVQQENGPGMLGTNGGYGRINPVPMLTGTVSDVNLMPTTTTGTTYPIGSALVIEPRDAFFQDYVDNASSRQNFDERQQ